MVRGVVAIADAAGPPRFVELAAHPLRWSVLGALVQSDRTVRELTALVGESQNLVSYHLRQLRDGGVVAARKSAADGRDVYYSVDLEACRDALRDVGAALHPALALVPPRGGVGAMRRRPRVLFLCTGNSARSQMAEALAVELSGGRVAAASAGSHPKPLHPNAVRAMRQRGIDISANRTKPIAELAHRRFDVVVTLCDKVREACPDLPSHPTMVHWSIADPAADGTKNRDSYPAFARTAALIETRVRFLLAMLTTPRR